MAKNTRNTQQLATAVTATPVTRTFNPENELPFEMDLKVTMNDVVNLAVTDAEETLLLEQETRERNNREAGQDHAAKSSKLGVQAETLIAGQQLNGVDTVQLMDLLRKKTGKMYVARMMGPEFARYSSDTREPRVDVQKAKINGSVCIFEMQKTEEKYNNQDPIINWPTSIEFTAEMKATVQEIAAAAKHVSKTDEALLETRRKLADVRSGRMARRAQGELTRAALSGQLKSGKAALEAVMGTKNKALPGRGDVAQLLDMPA